MNSCSSQDRLVLQNLNPAKAVGMVLISTKHAHFQKSRQEPRQALNFLPSGEVRETGTSST
jgi:hypothetical protein